MLQKAQAAATLPAKDLARAREFYEHKLGFTPDAEEREGGVVFTCADGTGFLLFQSTGSSSGTHTQISFDVKDIDAEVSQLKAKGVKFEDYDFPGLKTENGIAKTPDGRGGWFKDSEGNLIAVFQTIPVASRARG